jgi:lysophospholipase L1-like esterase
MLKSLWLVFTALVALSAAPSAFAEPANTSFKFDFSPKPSSDHIAVAPTAAYSKERGHGFDFDTKPESLERGVTSAKPFFFSVALPEGNYNVTVTLGDPGGESVTTVKAEQRRLMLEHVKTAPGNFETRTFTVNVRRPQISTGGEIKRISETAPEWDDKLTLEFSDTRPALCSLEIAKVEDAVTIYIAGDSTVTDQAKEPYNSWGQMLPRFFKPGVTVANYAKSGASLKSFVGDKRIDKVMSVIKPGDYFFIQFGHNDQKDKTPGAGAFTSYKDLLKRFVADAKQKGATPVLITAVSRRSFGPEGKIVNNLGDFPDAVRQTAKEENVPLIDLNAMSHPFYEAMGPDKSKQAFAPGDNTHHNNYGSYELAKCVVEGIKTARLPLAAYLTLDTPLFNPSQPDPIESFTVPASPGSTTTKPEGN